MAKAPSSKKLKFPFPFTKNGRTGKIYKLGTGRFKTYFQFAGKPQQNTFATFDAALVFLDGEFSKLDTDRANALSLHPLNGDVRNYSELEHLLREKGNGATLREAVAFFLAFNKNKRFEPKTFEECRSKFIERQIATNTPIHVVTLQKHYRRFEKDFACKKIHEISTLEVEEWLLGQKSKRTGEKWSPKTQASVLGSLVSLSLYAQRTLNAIPEIGETAFQKVGRPAQDEKEAVEIYTPEEFRTLLLTAVDTDIDMIPCLVAGGFLGLRPFEFHAETLAGKKGDVRKRKRRPLQWEAFDWKVKQVNFVGQKIRAKPTRNIPFHLAAQAWLEPFKDLTGDIWQHKQAHSKKLLALRKAAKTRSIYDGFRHSYASYRIRHLKGDLSALADEMGNSPSEIITSYKRNVSDKEADEWFGVMPPPDYEEKIMLALNIKLLHPPLVRTA